MQQITIRGLDPEVQKKIEVSPKTKKKIHQSSRKGYNSQAV
jgi:hypothetical protein